VAPIIAHYGTESSRARRLSQRRDLRYDSAMKLAPLLLAFLLAAAAPPPEAVEGTYVLHRMEVGSALRLTGDGRFQWFFSTGALDLAGEGRWEKGADNAVILTSDPPVVPPRVELAATTRDRKGGVLVQVTDPAGVTPDYLEVVAEYSDGRREQAYFEEGGHRFRTGKGRRILAVRLGSPPFDLVSDRYPVTAAGNVLAFRFLPNGLGQESFAGSRVEVEPNALILNLRGDHLRYERMTAEDEEEEALQAEAE
jgi:hypothetical protein